MSVKKGSKQQGKFYNPTISRRSFLKFVGLGTLYWTLPIPKISWSKNQEQELLFSGISPIDRTLNLATEPRGFSGDEPDRAHQILWDKMKFITSRGGIPDPEEHVPLVIIGAGVSGLMSAYLLRHHQPLILECASRFGGNSKGQSWHGIDYCIGAAYLMKPAENSKLDQIFRELKIYDFVRVKEAHDPIVWNQKICRHFWDGETSPENDFQFRRLFAYFDDVLKNKNGQTFPEIPFTNPGQRDLVANLDRKTFKNHLEEIVGGDLHPHIQTAIEYFCWSSLGASSTELSAASALNFYCGELGELLVAPGGNAAIAERILKELVNTMPSRNFRTNSVVFDIRVVSDGVIIAYADSTDKIRSIHSKAVILSCPKFVVAKMLNDIEPERLSAIRHLQYNSYLVANVLLKKPIKDDFYDLFLIGDGTIDLSNVEKAAGRQKVTDVVLGTYAKVDPERSILTLYRGMPFPGARMELYEDDAYEQYYDEFQRQIAEVILPLVDASSQDVVDLRLARWGHPLPVSESGLIANGTTDIIRTPFRDRVFFVEQDNWMLPAFETAAEEAIIWTPLVDRFLKEAD